MCQANFQLGRAFGDAVIRVVENNGFKLTDIDLIGACPVTSDPLAHVNNDYHI